jgi:deoxyribonuclease V
MKWPRTREELIEEQRRLAALDPPLWRFEPGERIGGVFVCFARGSSGRGRAGERAWAAARAGGSAAVVSGQAGAPYESGLLALREGALLEAAVCGLPGPPDVLLVDATGRDHPRRAGRALHLGALLDVATIGAPTAHSSPRATGRRTSATQIAQLPDRARVLLHVYYTGSAGRQPVVTGQSRFDPGRNACSRVEYRVRAGRAG